MKSRFFGASSYDDDFDDEEAGDMSGFISDMNPPQPPVIERKRSKPSGEGLGNMASRSVPPPQSNIGYTIPVVSRATLNTGSPWNPLWAHDETLGPNIVPVALKTAGIAGIFAGAVYSAGSRSIKGFGGKMIVGGTAAYLHPALGLGHGAISNLMGDRANWQIWGTSLLTQGIGGYVFYRILKM